jgi:hypothetical protein
VDLLPALTGVHAKQRHAVLKDGMVKTTQVREVKREATTVVQAGEETRDHLTLAGVAQRDHVQTLESCNALGGNAFTVPILGRDRARDEIIFTADDLHPEPIELCLLLYGYVDRDFQDLRQGGLGIL